MPRNDPTDTGGLFIGRRPGTGPLHYRGAPERGGAGRRRTDGALAALLLVLEVLLCLTLWGPQPVAWLWIGSQVDYQTGSVTAGIAVAFAGMIGSLMLTLALAHAARPRVADPAPRRRPRAARGRPRADLRGDRGPRRTRLPRLVHHPRRARSEPGAAVIRRLRDYYRQFEELSPEEISLELRERRDAERASALTEVQPLDLDHAGLARAAARRGDQRRHLRAPPRGQRLPGRRRAAPARWPTATASSEDQVAPGHGAGELLHAAFVAIAAGGRVAIAWPGWSPLPGLVHEAGAAPVPVPLTDGGAPDTEALAAIEPDTSAVVLCTPNDPTGAVAPDLRRWPSGSPEPVWLVVDAALAELGPDEDAADAARRARARADRALVLQGARDGGAARRLRARQRRRPARPAEPGRRRLGARAGRDAVGGPRGRARWSRRRRAAAARERERLADALRDSPFSFAAGHGHLVWLSSTEEDGASIARRLAAQRIYVTPGADVGRRGARADRAARRRRHRPAGRRPC